MLRRFPFFKLTASASLIISLSLPLTSQAFWGFFERPPEPPEAAAGGEWRELKGSESLSRQASLERIQIEAGVLLTSEFPGAFWWQRFGDSYLNAYVEKALNANHTLAQAEQRIEEARQLAKITRSAELPQVSLAPSYSIQKFSDVQFPFSGGGGANTQVGVAGNVVDFFNFPIEASYEVDLWQRNRDLTRAANQQTAMTQADYHNLRQQVASQTVGAYVNLILADRLVETQTQVIEALRQDVARFTTLLKGGLVAEDALALRKQALEAATAQLGPYERAQAQQLNALAVLMGETPAQVGALPRASLLDWQALDGVPVGVPSTLVEHRPDVQIREAELHQAFYNVRAAKKAFLPTIQLGGNYGFFSATDYRDFFVEEALGWSANVGVNQPLFRGGALKAGLKQNQAQAERVTHAYQEAVLTAFREVEDSLAGLKGTHKQWKALERQSRAKQTELEKLLARAEVGLIATGELYPHQAELALFQQSEATAKAAYLVEHVGLFKALGGGYEAPAD